MRPSSSNCNLLILRQKPRHLLKHPPLPTQNHLLHNRSHSLPRLPIHMRIHRLLVPEPLHHITHILLLLVLNKQNTQGPWLGFVNRLHALDEDFAEGGAFARVDGVLCVEDDLGGGAGGFVGTG